MSTWALRAKHRVATIDPTGNVRTVQYEVGPPGLRGKVRLPVPSQRTAEFGIGDRLDERGRSPRIGDLDRF